MEFLVSIDNFNGPLDLMLHLIKENKLDLFDLDLNILATQYIDYIQQMQSMHLEIASEYLSELASLIEYKSKKLLPREKVEVKEEYEEDQRDQLVKRLIEYQKYKEASENLKENYENRIHQFDRPISSLVEEWRIPAESEKLVNQSPYDLMKAMKRVMQRYTLLQPYETKVTIKEISVDERLEQVKKRLAKTNSMISFDVLCNDCSTLHMVIVTFLAILDLIHQKWIHFTVDEDEIIWVQRSVCDE